MESNIITIIQILVTIIVAFITAIPTKEKNRQQYFLNKKESNYRKRF